MQDQGCIDLLEEIMQDIATCYGICINKVVFLIPYFPD